MITHYMPQQQIQGRAVPIEQPYMGRLLEQSVITGICRNNRRRWY